MEGDGFVQGDMCHFEFSADVFVEFRDDRLLSEEGVVDALPFGSASRAREGGRWEKEHAAIDCVGFV